MLTCTSSRQTTCSTRQKLPQCCQLHLSRHAMSRKKLYYKKENKPNQREKEYLQFLTEENCYSGEERRSMKLPLCFNRATQQLGVQEEHGIYTLRTAVREGVVLKEKNKCKDSFKKLITIFDFLIFHSRWSHCINSGFLNIYMILLLT